MILISVTVATDGAAAGSPGPAVADADMSNIEAIGRVLYTDYVYIFQASGIVLLIAMIGAIVLTLRHKPGVRRQDIHQQVTRDAKSAIEIKKGVETGAGVSPEELR
jgi:NADH-quinone oxidoreductase subunit J